MNRLPLDVQSVRQHIEHLKLLYPELADDVQLLADTLEGETDLHYVLVNLVREQREAGAYADAIRAQEKELAERRGRFERRRDMHRSLMLSLLQTAGLPKVVLPEATLSVTNVAPKPIVDDEASVPDELCNFNRWPNMSAIKAAVKAGERVPGVHMSNGGTTLTIRIK
jgi:hypothetical protein